MCWETGQHWKAAMLSHASGRFNGDSPGGGTEPWHLKVLPWTQFRDLGSNTGKKRVVGRVGSVGEHKPPVR